eukprot:scaffold91144_cov67-Phaeocystis_antarctica.AAC.5
MQASVPEPRVRPGRLHGGSLRPSVLRQVRPDLHVWPRRRACGGRACGGGQGWQEEEVERRLLVVSRMVEYGNHSLYHKTPSAHDVTTQPAT